MKSSNIENNWGVQLVVNKEVIDSNEFNWNSEGKSTLGVKEIGVVVVVNSSCE